ncbi:MAG: DUF4340 domain-containing protein, partial [Candidatus Acidiferrales bacterium]
MIKKSTLFVLLAAIILGAVVYYFDGRSSKQKKTPVDTTKPAFNLQASDIQSFTLSRPSKTGETPIQFEKKDGTWIITQPVETGADQPSVNGITDGIASARISQTEPGAPDRLKAYGLDPAEVSIDFQMKSGAKHTLLLGLSGFAGTSVYSVVDGGKNVLMLPVSLLTSADKPLGELRDRTILNVKSDEVTSFDLKNASGELVADKQGSDWEFSKPSAGRADSEAIGQLLAPLESGKFLSVASETPEHPAKYGLEPPAITLKVEQGKNTETLLVGKKEGVNYYARDASRPVIFLIGSDLHDKLVEKFSDLRDKTVLHFEAENINHVEVHNPSGLIAMTRKSAEDWSIDEPANEKGKTA